MTVFKMLIWSVDCGDKTSVSVGRRAIIHKQRISRNSSNTTRDLLFEGLRALISFFIFLSLDVKFEYYFYEISIAFWLFMAREQFG